MNTKLMFSSASNEWETPRDLFEKLNDEFGFTLDPCCTEANRTCKNYYTIRDNGLAQNWDGHSVYVNPPYGRDLGKWVKKCYEESLRGVLCVMCIPSRTDTRWFHDYIYGKAEIRFLKGRLRFINRFLPSYNKNGDFRVSPAPFPSMVVVFRPTHNNEQRN